MTRRRVQRATVRGVGRQVAVRWPRRGAGYLSGPAADIVIAMLLLIGALVALTTLSQVDSSVVAIVSCVVAAGAIAVRRRRPMPAALTALAGLVGYELATHDPNGAFLPVAVVLSFYTLGRSGTLRRHPLAGVAAVAIALAGCAVIASGLHDSGTKALGSWLLVAVVPLMAGIGLARRATLSAELTATAAQLRAEQDHNARRASAEERNRVARDLHDVVAHCVSVMVVQAGAARLIAEHDPAAAAQALTVIGACGRDALADLRRIVGVLHRDVDPNFGSGAGLADLARLAERITLAGVPTRTTIEGTAALPPAVDVVAYRVAQEALTNVVKHAGDGATADVHVHVGAAAVLVEVTDAGGSGAAAAAPASGHGLAGMRERVTAYGGELRCGPRSCGGYSVAAPIPVRHESTSASQGAAVSGPRSKRRRRWPGWASESLLVTGWLAALETEAALSAARHGPWALNAAAVALMAMAATWRRRRPLAMLAVVGVLAAALSGGLTSLDQSTLTGLYSLSVPLFSVACWQPRTGATIGLALWTVGAMLVAVTRHAALGGLAGALVMGLVVWAAGRVWRAQRALNAELAETTRRLVAERDQRAELVVTAERTRIARELHGLVAHGVVTMVVQAEAARKLLTRHSSRATDAMVSIEATGRDVLSQLRRILGVLRAPRSANEPMTHTRVHAPVPAYLRDAALPGIPEEVLA